MKMQPYILIDIIHQIVAVIYIIYKSTSENKELSVVLSKYMVKLLLMLNSYLNLIVLNDSVCKITKIICDMRIKSA